MDPIFLNIGFAAFLYAVAAGFSKRALSEEFGVLALCLVVNLVFVGVFALPLLGGVGPVPANLWWQPVLAGTLFFLGQLFTFCAIRFGDVSIQTPIMGTKVVFVILISVVFGLERIGPAMAGAAVLSMTAVALLGASGHSWKSRKALLTVALALLSALFFGASDVVVGRFGKGFGIPMFLFLSITINALLSFLLIPFFKTPMRQASRCAWTWALLAGLGMGVQAVILNYTLSFYQEVAKINVVYSIRGLWSVVLVVPLSLLIGIAPEVSTRRVLVLRLIGAGLMTGSILLLFSTPLAP